MRRALAATAVIFAGLLLTGSPALAGQGQGALTIATESRDIWFTVAVAGRSLPAAAKLADASGEHVADVAVTAGACPARDHAPRREVGLAGSTWCVHVSNLQAGYAVTGTIASPETTLSLTVKRKVGPGFPILWSVVALAVAALVSWLASTYVPGITSRLRLRLYERDGGVAGLGEWVTTAAAEGTLADDDVVARAQWARKYGRKQVLDKRSQLRTALAGPGHVVPQDSPLSQACHAEVMRSTADITRQDMLTDEGARAIKAAVLLDALTKASTAISDFTSSANEIIATLTDPVLVEQATRVRDQTLSSARGLSADMVPQFITTLASVAQSMHTAFQTELVQLRAADRLVAAATSGAAPQLTAAAITTSVREAFAPVAVYLPAVLLAFAIMAGAVATVFSAQYLVNPNFGTIADYWTLIVSAYGSAQATAIAAALLLIRSPKPWFG